MEKKLAIVTRSKQYMLPGQCWRTAWRWSYNVNIAGNAPAGCGTMDEVKTIARRNNARLVKDWIR